MPLVQEDQDNRPARNADKIIGPEKETNDKSQLDPNSQPVVESNDVLLETSEKAVPQGPTIFVGDVPTDVTKREILDTFRKYGRLGKISIIRSQEGLHRTFAFVEFENVEDFRKCVEKGYEYIGKIRILVKMERETSKKDYAIGIKRLSDDRPPSYGREFDNDRPNSSRSYDDRRTYSPVRQSSMSMRSMERSYDDRYRRRSPLPVYTREHRRTEGYSSRLELPFREDDLLYNDFNFDRRRREYPREASPGYSQSEYYSPRKGNQREPLTRDELSSRYEREKEVYNDRRTVVNSPPSHFDKRARLNSPEYGMDSRHNSYSERRPSKSTRYYEPARYYESERPTYDMASRSRDSKRALSEVDQDNFRSRR